MARLLDETEVKIEWADMDRRVCHKRPQSQRSKGIHLSGILEHVVTELRLLESGQVDKEDLADKDVMPLRMVLGTAWEEMCASLYPDLHWQPGELERDGVAGSPDGEMYVPYRPQEELQDHIEPLSCCIVEFKYTYKSAAPSVNKVKKQRDILKDWMWMGQLKGYMAMHPAGTGLAELHVCYAAGDYTFPLTPIYKKYLIEFSTVEVETFWQNIILPYKEKIGAEA